MLNRILILVNYDSKVRLKGPQEYDLLTVINFEKKFP
jgi:hypothetical protein